MIKRMPSRLRRYDVPGHIHFLTISCYRRLPFFDRDDMKRIVVDGLALLQDKFGVCLVGYVVMPEHVHILIHPHARGCDTPVAVSRQLNEFKQYVGYHGKRCLRETWRRDGRLWCDRLDRWARGGFSKQAIWNTRGYDFNIDRRDTLIEKLDYCHKNPITRGLVENAEDWRWSSYRFYELDDCSVLAMDWDGRWPVVW